MRQHEAIVQLCAPAHQTRGRVRRTPETRHEGAQQELLREAHPLVGRHFEGTQLEQPQPPGRAIGRIQLVDAEFGAMRIAGHVDEQIAEQPIDEPGRARDPGRRQLAKGDLELTQRVISRFVQAWRLRRGADEQAGEQIRQRGMIVPIRQKAPQQVGTAQERRIRGGRAT